jgi:hypothetical protein
LEKEKRWWDKVNARVEEGTLGRRKICQGKRRAGGNQVEFVIEKKTKLGGEKIDQRHRTKVEFIKEEKSSVGSLEWIRGTGDSLQNGEFLSGIKVYACVYVCVK